MLIYRREWRQNWKGLLIWTLVLSGLNAIQLSVYPQMAEQQENLDALLQSIPEAMANVFHLGELDFSTIIGFYAIECYLILTLFGSIYAANLAAQIVAKEESEKTIEFLLSKPVTRRRVLTEKGLLVLTNILLFNLVISLINLLVMTLLNETPDAETFLLISVGPLLLHLTFAAVTFFLSVILSKGWTLTSLSAGLVLLFYFLSVMSDLTDKLEWLKYLSPFAYVDPADIILDHEIKPLYLLIMLAVILLSLGSAYAIYNKKDITV